MYEEIRLKEYRQAAIKAREIALLIMKDIDSIEHGALEVKVKAELASRHRCCVWGQIWRMVDSDIFSRDGRFLRKGKNFE